MEDQLIRFIVTSDTHAYWLNHPENNQLSLMNTAGCVTALKAKPADLTLTLDLGDFLQGSSFATYLKQERSDGRVIGRAMNAIGYDYQLIGNHEFNFGPEYRDSVLEELNSQILLSNIVNEGTIKPFTGKAYEIIEHKGIKIGIVGVTTSYIPNWELPKNYQGLEFIDAFEAAKLYVDQIRPKVDVVIVAYHGGFERDLATGEVLEELTKENQGYEMLKDIEGIDLLLTGHQHRIINQKIGDTWVIQPGHAGERVAEIEMTLNIEHHKIKKEIKGTLHNSADYSRLLTLKETMEPEISQGEQWLSKVLGYAPLQQATENPLTARALGHPFVEMLNQIQLSETGADFSAAALINNYFTEFYGEITHETLLQCYPYFNLIAKTKVTGEDLYQALEFNYEYFDLNKQGELAVNEAYLIPKVRHYNFDIYSGLEITVDITKPVGQRIVNLINESNGLPINRNQHYTLALSQYRAVGGGDFKWFTKEKIQTLSEIDLATLLQKALHTYTETKWNKINQQYSHVDWLPNPLG